MLAGPKPADLAGAFALPVPTLAICQLPGMPYEDHGFFRANTRVSPAYGTSLEEEAAARRQLIGYLDGLVGQQLTGFCIGCLWHRALRRVWTGSRAC
jgi:hypothetical protein